MALGALNIEVSANFARFASDMGKVAQIAEDNARKMDKVFGVVATSLKAIGAGAVIGLTIDKLKGKIEDAISAAAGLKQLAERTGATVEGLSSLAATAKLSGTDTEQLAVGLQKLSKALVDAKDGGAKTGAAFTAIGISTKDLIGLRPDEAFLLISNRLAKYADGAEKTAVAQVVLGKAGANLLPVMNDLAVVGQYQTKVTAKQAEQADNFEKNLKRLSAVQNSVFKTIAAEIIPVLDEFAKALLTSATQTGGLRGAVQDLAKDKSIRNFAEDAAIGITILIASITGAVKAAYALAKSVQVIYADSKFALQYLTSSQQDRQDFHSQDTGPLRKSLDERNAVLKSAGAAYSEAYNFDSRKLERDVRERFKLLNEAEAKGGDAPARKQLKFNPNTAVAKAARVEGDEDKVAKAIFDGRIKALDHFVQSEAEKLAVREKSLDFFQGLEYFTLRESEERKQKLIADDIALTAAAYDKEIQLADRRIAALEESTAKVKSQETVDNRTEVLRRVEAFEAKVEETRNKRAEFVQKREDAETKSNQRIGDSQNRLLAITQQFDLATAEGERQAEKANQATAFSISLLGQNTLAVEKANIARQIEVGLQERIFQLRKEFGSGAEAEVARAVAASEREKASALQLVTEAYEKQRSAGFGASEAFRKYAEDAQNAGAQIENSLTNAFKSAEDALVNFVKTGKLDFRSLADSIATDIIRMGVKSVLGGSGDKNSIFGANGLIGSAGAALGIGGGNAQGIGEKYSGGFLGSLGKLFGLGKDTSKGVGIDAAGHGFSAAKDGAIKDGAIDDGPLKAFAASSASASAALATQTAAFDASTIAINALAEASRSAALFLARPAGDGLRPAGDGLVVDPSGQGIDAAGHGFSAAKDGPSGQVAAADKLATSQTDLTTATLAQNAAAIASAAGFGDAAKTLSAMSSAAQFASQALALINATSAASSASSGGGGFLSTVVGLFGGSANKAGGSASAGFGSGAGFGNADLGTFLAAGTNYVPYDGMKAVLHKGEAVVPAAYNPANPANGASGDERSNSGNTTVVNLTQNFAPGTSTQTTGQAAVQAAQLIRRAQRDS